MGVVIEVAVLPLSLPARTIVAAGPDLAPRLAGAGDDSELVFAPPQDAAPAIGCLSPELASAITVVGEIETKAGGRAADAARKRVPITASRRQRF